MFEFDEINSKEGSMFQSTQPSIVPYSMTTMRDKQKKY
jgi:hypothetical protein